MEELQARLRAFQASKTESNALRQPDFEPAALENDAPIVQGNVVGIPARDLIAEPPVEPAARSKGGGKAASAKKSQTTAAKQKSAPKKVAAAPRRIWTQSPTDRNNEVEPDTWAERYNYQQLNRGSQTTNRAASGQRGYQSPTNPVSVNSPPEQTGQAANSLRPIEPQYQPGEVPLMPARRDDRRNQPDNRQGGKLPGNSRPAQEGHPQARDRMGDMPRQPRPAAPATGYPSHHQPETRRDDYAASDQDSYLYGQGAEAEPHAIKNALRDTGETALALRSLNYGEQRPIEPVQPSTLQSHSIQSPTGQPHNSAAPPLNHPPSTSQRRHRKRRRKLPRRADFKLQNLVKLPEKWIDRVGDAVLWVVVAAVVQVGVRFLLASQPVLTPILYFLMLAPATLAVYLAGFVPQAKFVWVYRLFLITVGLFLGTKL